MDEIEKIIKAVEGLRRRYMEENNPKKREDIKNRIKQLIDELTDIIK